MSLPPDPSKFNAIRAKRAEAALVAHEKNGTTGDPQLRVAMLLCNLNHWADRNGVDMAQALEDAAEFYEGETRGTD